MTALTSCSQPVQHTPRQRDRRQALSELLVALTRALDRGGDVALMRGAFEEMLRRAVPVRSVQLRDIGSRWSAPSDAAPAAESIALDVQIGRAHV